jgi:ribosomal protein eL43
MKTTKRFGARYGKRVKDRLQAIEEQQKEKQKCPYCRKAQVKRLGVGLFTCHKCGAKFTGKAYAITQPRVDVEPEVEPKVEEPEEPDESFDDEEPSDDSAKEEEEGEGNETFDEDEPVETPFEEEGEEGVVSDDEKHG